MIFFFWRREKKMSVWKIYYDHWGKEQNRLQKEEYKKKCADKLLLNLFKLFFYVDENLETWKNPKIRKELIQGVKTSLEWQKSVEDDLYYLHEFSKALLNEDILPSVKRIRDRKSRLIHHLGKKFYVENLETGEQAHRLDALLAFI